MADSEAKGFEVILTDPAINRFYEIVEFFYDLYSIHKAELLSKELRDMVGSLVYHPERGAIEPRLVNRGPTYRFILFRRSLRADIKILYYVLREKKQVFVTDFFPTEMDDRKLPNRL